MSFFWVKVVLLGMLPPKVDLSVPLWQQIASPPSSSEFGSMVVKLSPKGKVRLYNTLTGSVCETDLDCSLVMIHALTGSNEAAHYSIVLESGIYEIGVPLSIGRKTTIVEGNKTWLKPGAAVPYTMSFDGPQQ